MDKSLGNGRNAFLVIYLLGFLFAFHHAVSAYINSSFLETVGPESAVGIVFSIGSALSILGLALIPKVLARFGNYRTLVAITVLSAVLLLGLGYFKSFAVIAPIFALYLSLIPLIVICLDIFLEKFSDNEKTGIIRGSYLTTVNSAWVISPLLAGLVLTNGDYWKIYLFSAMLLVVSLAVLRLNLRDFDDTPYQKTDFWGTIKQISARKDVWRIFASNILLQFFYAWMIIYAPIYLHQYIGLSWKEIGVIFTVMLLPFIFLQAPAGRLADKRFGEKEILSLGFVIMALSTAAIFFIGGKNVFVWGAMLLLTRIGASMVEVMTESYFFKHMDSSDANVISAWRRNLPLAFVVAPLLASVILSFADYKYLFLILGVLMLYGLRYSLTIKDTR